MPNCKFYFIEIKSLIENKIPNFITLLSILISRAISQKFFGKVIRMKDYDFKIFNFYIIKILPSSTFNTFSLGVENVR